MRCLTLAMALRLRGHECRFICRKHMGHLAEFIVSRGFAVDLLTPPTYEIENSELNWNLHAPWLGVSWQQDAEETKNLLKEQAIDWIVVDHYALDVNWEQQLLTLTNRIMVIDDLADRAHKCDLLLDQTYGRRKEDYQPLVSKNCELLCGSQFALLRPEFSRWRDYSLQRRQQPTLKQLLLNMGGVDKDNITGKVLDALHKSDLSNNCQIVVVMGASAPWLNQIKQKAESIPWNTEVKVGVNNIAELMANSDLAIGAAGSTTWERCCLGLPSIMIVLAENQQKIASQLAESRAAVIMQANFKNSDLTNLINTAQLNQTTLVQNTQAICDGLGVQRVIERLDK